MADASTNDSPFYLVTRCMFTINDKTADGDEKLCKSLTDELGFKIVSFDPLRIEKENPSHDDINRLYETLKILQNSLEIKCDERVEYQVQLSQLEQSEENARSMNSAHTSSSQEVNENREMSKNKRENPNHNSCKYLVSMQQEIDIDDLTSNFQHLNVNDKGHYQEYGISENSLNRVSTFQELTNEAGLNDNATFLRNGKVTKEQENVFKDKDEDERQIVKTEEKFQNNEEANTEQSNADVQTTKNTIIPKEIEMKHGSHNEKQDNQCMKHGSTYDEKLIATIKRNETPEMNLTDCKQSLNKQDTETNREIKTPFNNENTNQILEILSSIKTCKQTEDFLKCHRDAESLDKNISVTHSCNATTQDQFNSKIMENAAAHTKENAITLPESKRKNQTENHPQNSQHVKTDEKHFEMPMNSSKTKMNHLQNCERHQNFALQDLNISAEMNMQKHEENKNENPDVISNRPSADCRKTDFDWTFNVEKRQHNCCISAQIIEEVHKQTLKHDRNKDPEDISNGLASRQTTNSDASAVEQIEENMYKLKDSESQSKITEQTEGPSYLLTAESRQNHARVMSSASDVHPPYITRQGSSSQQMEKTSEYMQIKPHTSTFEGVGNDNEILTEKQLIGPAISSENSNIPSNSESCDANEKSQNEIIYAIKTSSLDAIKMYFKEASHDEYFANAKPEGTGFTFTFNSDDERDMAFFYKLKKLKIEEWECCQNDETHLKSAIKDIHFEISEIYIHLVGRKVSIVGPKEAVTAAKKKLLLSVKNNHEKTPQYPVNIVRHNESFTTKARFQNTGINSDESEKDISDTETRSSSRSTDKSACFEDRRCNFSISGDLFISQNCELKVNIFNADITKLQVDCIVNAANKKLNHGGGVAKVISQAAGPALIKECDKFQLKSQVEVTGIFASTAGNLHAKCVLHAVGPKWDAYKEKNKCFDDLRRTVLRCLVEADRQGFTSIAFPSISAAIFKVPREDCARCYMQAVKHYSIFSETRTSSLQYINFVDVDDSMVTIIKTHFKNNWTKSCDSHLVQEDCDFAKKLYDSASTNIQRQLDTTKRPLTSVSTIAPTSEMTTRSYGFKIGKFILRTDSIPAFNHSSDVVTITVGKPFDKLSGLQDYSISSNLNKTQSKKNVFKMFSVSKPKSRQQRCLFTLLPEPDDAEKIKKAIENLDKIVESSDKMAIQNLKHVILTSHILYDEPYNTQNKGKKQGIDRKKPGDFARCLFEYLKHSSQKTASETLITVVGSEDALQSIHKVFESREVQLKPLSGGHSSYKETNSRTSSSYPQLSSSTYSSNVHDDRQYAIGGPPSADYEASGITRPRVQGSDYRQDDSRQHHRHSTKHYREDVGSSVDSEKSCPICEESRIIHPVRCCGNEICQSCEQKMSQCPFCRKYWTVAVGNQPPGTMSVRIIHDSVAGYEPFPTLEIEYFFPSGIQQKSHPNPGMPFNRIRRTAFLPGNEAGLHVLMLLRLAFLRKLTFTIGRSLTTDIENSIVWNDIHHKTKRSGGTYGYPDPNYLQNVTRELANKGVTFETLSLPEKYEIDTFREQILTARNFLDISLK